MTWFLDLRSDSVGGVTASQVLVRQGNGHYPNFTELVAQAQGRDVLFVTHGFNVNRFDGVASLSGWEQLLDLGPEALFIGVLWPGDSRWMPVLDYPFEDSEAVKSATLLAGFVDSHFSNAASRSFVSHSLGARVVLETISRMQLPVSQAILMAGAIDDDCLSVEYKSTVSGLSRVSLLASLEDHVLKIAFPLGNPLAGVISKGHPYWHGALGRSGPDQPSPVNVDPHWAIPDVWKYDHSDYLGGTPPKVDVPVNLPPASTFKLVSKPAWSAAFVSARFKKGLGQ